MGEKMDTLDVFYPDRMAQRILDMGDILSLVEKAKAEFDEKEAQRLEKKIRKNQFDFNDFLTQLGHIKKMGNIKSLMAMIPGMGKMAQNMDIDERAFVKIEAIIQSMTPEERSNPALIGTSRKKRIAGGSGNKVEEINQFLKQFEQMRQMMFQMSKMTGPGGQMKMPKMPFPPMK
jgi:signal recognition particle subunit SRP54